jgi:ABC-type uncharacterized transport system involved in gliding motility auxiliary subunit
MAQNDTISAKQARFAATATLYTIVVIAILIAANWLANRYNKTYDTTRNKRYTLSEQTKKIVRDLKTDATITYFDRPDGFKQAQGILDRYGNLSHKIHVQYVNPLKDPTLAMAYGVRTAGTAFVTVDKRREEARALTEEGITTAFLKDLKGVRRVCFVHGSGERDLNDNEASGIAQLKTVLQHDNYEAQDITLLDKTAVPSDCRVLVVAGPKSNYTPNEIEALRNYVQGGGSALFALDPPLALQHEQISDNKPLTDLLAGWGVTLDKDIVLEQNPEVLTADLGPVFPLVINYESHPITNDLKNHYTGFAITRSLQVKNGDKTTVQKLLSTTDSAVTTSHLDQSGINIKDPANQHGIFALGAAGTYNTGQAGKEGRFVVYGTSRLLDNSETGVHFQANRDLVLNTINWLASDEDLISIRPKEAEDQHLSMNQTQVRLFNYTDLIALPLLIIVAGVSILWKRR